MKTFDAVRRSTVRAITGIISPLLLALWPAQVLVRFLSDQAAQTIMTASDINLIFPARLATRALMLHVFGGPAVWG